MFPDVLIPNFKSIKSSKYSRNYLKVKTKQKKWASAFKRKYHFNEIQLKKKKWTSAIKQNYYFSEIQARQNNDSETLDEK